MWEQGISNEKALSAKKLVEKFRLEQHQQLQQQQQKKKKKAEKFRIDFLVAVAAGAVGAVKKNKIQRRNQNECSSSFKCA